MELNNKIHTASGRNLEEFIEVKTFLKMSIYDLNAEILQ